MSILTAPKSSQTPILSLRGICKQFPGVLANNNIDLDIFPSEIHALLGENGAGKSTLNEKIIRIIPIGFRGNIDEQ